MRDGSREENLVPSLTLFMEKGTPHMQPGDVRGVIV